MMLDMLGKPPSFIHLTYPLHGFRASGRNHGAAAPGRRVGGDDLRPPPGVEPPRHERQKSTGPPELAAHRGPDLVGLASPKPKESVDRLEASEGLSPEQAAERQVPHDRLQLFHAAPPPPQEGAQPKAKSPQTPSRQEDPRFRV